jgi:threonine aldolase
LEQLAAETLGKEAALLVTSGTQGNLTCLMAQSQPGDEVLLEGQSHVFMFESGGLCAVGGLIPRQLQGEYGYLPSETIAAAIRSENIHNPRSRILSLENSHNLHGGTCVTSSQTREMAKVAHDFGLNVHIDGARIFNAATALKEDIKDLVKSADSVQFCLSKGLACPVGSLILGTSEFIKKARRIRKQLGGGLRQAGIIAAPGIIGLQKMTKRLIEDHENAQRLTKGIQDIPGVKVQFPQTNIINMWLENTARLDAYQLRDALSSQNIRIMCRSQYRIRMVTHYGITSTDISTVIDAIKAQME